MLKITNKVSRVIWLLIYGQLTILLGLMIFCSITEPQHHLIPWQMAAGTVFGTGFFLTAFFFLGQVCSPEA